MTQQSSPKHSTVVGGQTELFNRTIHRPQMFNCSCAVLLCAGTPMMPLQTVLYKRYLTWSIGMKGHPKPFWLCHSNCARFMLLHWPNGFWKHCEHWPLHWPPTSQSPAFIQQFQWPLENNPLCCTVQFGFVSWVIWLNSRTKFHQRQTWKQKFLMTKVVAQRNS